jgi:hypothetical protein
MATLATQPVSRAGIVPAYAAAAAGGDKFAPGKDTLLHVKNGSAAAITVTIVTPKTTSYGSEIADNEVAVAAGSERLIGPFPYEHYADTDDGLGDITYSAVTSLTVGAFALGES